MAEVLVIGKKISEMGLVNEITGEEKIPTSALGDKAVTTSQLLTYVNNNGVAQWGRIGGDITNQVDLQNQFTQERDILKSYTQDQVSQQQVALQEHIDVTNGAFRYIHENGAALPYEEGVSYEGGAVVVKDGMLQQREGGVWKSVIADGLSNTVQTFITPEAGVDSVTGVADGAYFNVRSSSDESYVDEYRNVDGSAVATGKQYLSSLGVQMQEKSASTIKDTSGKNQQEINDDQKEINSSQVLVNGKLLGLVPFLNITELLRSQLNSPSNYEIYLPAGDYVITDQIRVESTPKKLIFQDGAVIKPSTISQTILFNIFSPLELDNPTFDFDNGNCYIALNYQANLGRVKIRNASFKNIKDMVSTYGTTMIQASLVGNKIDIDGVDFENCLKLGNGNITDGAGSINGLLLTGTTDLKGGNVCNVSVTEMHNIDASGNIVFEDTSGVYIATQGNPILLNVENVTGFNYGKRLVKNQASNVKFKNIVGHSDVGDSLSVLATMSDSGFTTTGVTVDGLIATGVCTYGLAVSSDNSVLDNININVDPPTDIRPEGSSTGVYVAPNTKGTKLIKGSVSAVKPIQLDMASGVLDLTLGDIDVVYKAGTGHAIASVNSGGKVSRITHTGVIRLFTHNAPTNRPQFMALGSSNFGHENLVFNRIEIFDAASNASSNRFNMGAWFYFKNISFLDVQYIAMNGESSVITGLDFFNFQNCIDVKLPKLSYKNTANRAILIQNCEGVDLGADIELNSSIEKITISTSTKVSIAETLEQYAITYGTQDASEIRRAQGLTTNRPKNVWVGFRFFDTTLGKPIFCKVVSPLSWVDATGATV